MIDMQQAPPAVTAPAEMPSARVVAESRSRCDSMDDGEIVVCGRRDDEQFRLRPLPPLASEPNILERPHVLKIGPVRIGLLGHGAGMGVALGF